MFGIARRDPNRLVDFDGCPVPAWWVRYLRAARRMGWNGRPIHNQDVIRSTHGPREANYRAAVRRERAEP